MFDDVTTVTQKEDKWWNHITMPTSIIFCISIYP